MEETLGKRIVFHRKRLGLTQDALATALGVTAQAVSKWENDQSCPDITTLPKLAELFGITTDELLGLTPRQVHVAEVVTEQDDAEPEGFHVKNGSWEFRWDGGRKSRLGLALWVLMVGGLSMIGAFHVSPYGFPSLWTLCWTCGLLLFGLFGLYPRFSVFRLGCALAGSYFLLNKLHIIFFYEQGNIVLPGCLILLGLSLLIDAMRKPSQRHIHFTKNGKTAGGSTSTSCTCEGEKFDCSTSFGENTYLISLPRLSRGSAEVSFGEMTVDLSGCEELAENCRICLECCFGQLTLLVPRRFCAELSREAAFGAVGVDGEPLPNASVFSVDCNASFGEITVRYI